MFLLAMVVMVLFLVVIRDTVVAVVVFSS